MEAELNIWKEGKAKKGYGKLHNEEPHKMYRANLYVSSNRVIESRKVSCSPHVNDETF